MIKKVSIALVIFVVMVVSLVYLLHRRDRPPSRPAVPPVPSVKSHALAIPKPAPSPVELADSILIEKSIRRLTLFRDGKPIKKYRVSLGFEPEGKKTMEGDGKTPEGCYIIDSRNEYSRFYRSLRISYPNDDDREQAEELGVSPGSNIMIHGLKNGFGRTGKTRLTRDWTLGCIAVTNREMDEIWRLAPVGTKVEIVP